jgi:uncharacterized membrane protein
MMQVHILELFATETIRVSHAGKILMFFGGPPVAPVFMIILGFFAGRYKSGKQLCLRGLKLFLLGMFLNVAMNLNLIISSLKGTLQIDIFPYLFGVDILHLAGLSLIVIGLTKKILERSITLALALSLLIAAGGAIEFFFFSNPIFIKYLASYLQGVSAWSYFPLLPWLAYPLTGFIISRLFQQGTEIADPDARAKLALLLGFTVFLVLTLKYAVRVSADLSRYYHHGIIFFLWTLVFLGGYAFGVTEVYNRFSGLVVVRYLKWLGRYVTAAYVIQWILIGNIATEIYQTVSSPLYLALWWITVLVLTTFLVGLYERIVKKKSIAF